MSKFDHPNIHPDVLERINKSKKDGGVFVNDLEIGTKLYVTTENTQYIIEIMNKKGDVLIGGHQKYCPEPTKMHFNGSTWGGSMMKVGWVGIGMHMELYRYSDNYKSITTTPVQKIEIVAEDYTFELPVKK